MPRRLNLPDSASIADAAEGGKLFAPSAERNADAICAAVADLGPNTGRALELASGTGQHAVALARALPGVQWQPSDIDPARRASIDAYVAEAGLPNLAAAVEIDATAPGWGASQAGRDLIVLVNLLHLVSEAEARTVVTEAAQALAPGGMLMIYGPFLRDGETTSEGDAQFHAALQAQDPEIGYKDDWEVIDWLQSAWLDMAHVVEMPANNLLLAARKPA